MKNIIKKNWRRSIGKVVEVVLKICECGFKVYEEIVIIV